MELDERRIRLFQHYILFSAYKYLVFSIFRKDKLKKKRIFLNFFLEKLKKVLSDDKI